jgi:hypothetical protein
MVHLLLVNLGAWDCVIDGARLWVLSMLLMHLGRLLSPAALLS